MIERAYEELNQFNWTEEELLTYEQEIKRIMDNQAAEDYKLQAEARGKAEGKIEVAKSLKESGVGVDIISQSIGLTKDQIEKL